MEEDPFGDSFPSLSEDFLHTSNSEAAKKRKLGASIMEELGDATMAAMVNNIEVNARDRKLMSTTMGVVGDVTMAALMCLKCFIFERSIFKTKNLRCLI